MRKNVFLAMAALVLLALSACAYDGRTTDVEIDLGETVYFYGVEKTTEPVDLLIWLDNEEWAHELIRAFVSQNPHGNVSVRFEQMGNVASRTHMQLDGPAGFGADIFAFPHDHVSWAINDGMIEPVPMALQQKWQAELQEAAVGTITHNGFMYGVPFQVENIALFYNRDLWGPQPPRTFEEIFAFAQTWNNPATNDWTMAWPVNDPYFNFPWLAVEGFRPFGPDMTDYRRPGFDSPEVARGLEFFLQLRDLFDLPLADINFNTAEERFRLGEIPLTITGPWAFTDLFANNVNFGVTTIPTIGGVQPTAFSGTMIAGVSSFSSEINRPWAYAFLDFMVSEEGARIQFEGIHTMTARRDISGIPGLRDDPHLAGIIAQSPFTVPMPLIPQVHSMWGPMEEMLSFVWDRDLSIPEAQTRAMESYTTLLAVAGIHID
ncbi:MAG: maltose ABC transporter substrate-binding protein [Defluviitaleaceae bacterium]|nr:maltose ABC transporter substrate-binding protein [Defluviitaleaceae bacterium]MCL2238473.1 maltose ABC transporter substrate-binding protein [Defluviitaleaceae bacterium]